jgi:cell division septation protein DedD
MKTNNLLTYLLYALLAGLVLVIGQKACKMKQDKAIMAKESAEMSGALRELGYTENDSTSSTHGEGTYKDGSAETQTQTTTGGGAKVSNDKAGIEGEEEETKPVTASTKSKPLVADTEEEPAKPSRTKVRDLDAEGSDSPRFMVLAGTFTVMDNAREQMEALVKKGFEEAEVGKFNRGKFACAIAKRTNSLADAKACMAKLKAKGFKDALVKERK